MPARKSTTRKTAVRGERKGKTATPSNPPVVAKVDEVVTRAGLEGRKVRKDYGTKRELTAIAEMAENRATQFKYVRPALVAQSFTDIAKAIRAYDQRDRLTKDRITVETHPDTGDVLSILVDGEPLS